MSRQLSSHASADSSQSVLRAFTVKPPYWLAMGRVPDLARLGQTCLLDQCGSQLEAFPGLFP